MNPNNIDRAERSRINGSKSQGPTSSEGKAKSSKNALKHGFAATVNNVLAIEDPQAFEAHVAGTHAAWKPKDYFETTLVDQIASITWRHARLIGAETSLLDAQISIQDQNVEGLHDSGVDPYFKLHLAWQALSRKSPTAILEDPTMPPDAYDIASIELLRRYSQTLDRQLRGAILNLRQYREAKKEEEQNEPSPEAQKPPRIHLVTPVPAPKPEPQPKIGPTVAPESLAEAPPEAA
jgi:hypothetical protein